MKNPLGWLDLENNGYEMLGDDEGTRFWKTPEDDNLELRYFPQPMPIAVDLTDTRSVREAWRQVIEAAGAGVVEIENPVIDDLPTIRGIAKVPQEPSGRVYVGTLVVPLGDSHFMWTVHCREHGITGMRDTMVFERLLASNEIYFDEKTGEAVGWVRDPYDTSLKGPMTANLSESPEWDEVVPDHPLSRARRVLNHLEKTMRVSGEAKPRHGR